MAEAPVNQGQSCVNLEDVFLYFTEEEWDLLSDAQKLLYHNVMLETFSLLLSLGLPISKSFPGSRLTGDILTHNALSGTMRCPLPSLLKVLPSLQNKQRNCIKRAQLRAECTSKQEPLGDSSDESRFQ